MESVNTWIAVAVGVITVLAGMAAMFRSTIRALDGRIDVRLGAGLDARLPPMEARIDARIDGLSDRLDGRIDGLSDRIDRLSTRMGGFDIKLDHLAEVVDLRLKPLEQDMDLIKRHILGLPAA